MTDDLKGRVCIVTGANSGIGKETALALASMSATVVMAVRNLKKGEQARKEIVNGAGNKSVEVMVCDLATMSSIHRFASEFKQKYGRLDVLINNAGAVFDRRQVTVDGFERTLAVDYLGPVLLTHELLEHLEKSRPSRIINISSGLANRGKIDMDDLQSERNYSGMKVYANAKLLFTLYTYELADRLKCSGVAVNAVMPGFVATNLGRNSGSLRSSVLFALVRPMQISAKKGAMTSVYLASSDECKEITGKCYTKQEITSSCPKPDQRVQKELWERTMKLLRLPSYLATDHKDHQKFCKADG